MHEPGLDLICVSHLGWDSVWQRPHQLLSRLARRQRVLWVDEPRVDISLLGARSVRRRAARPGRTRERGRREQDANFVRGVRRAAC